jgi:hypothetical protein
MESGRTTLLAIFMLSENASSEGLLQQINASLPVAGQHRHFCVQPKVHNHHSTISNGARSLKHE